MIREKGEDVLPEKWCKMCPRGVNRVELFPMCCKVTCLRHEVLKDGDGWFGDVKLLNSHINLDWVHGSLRLYDLYGGSGGFLF